MSTKRNKALDRVVRRIAAFSLVTLTVLLSRTPARSGTATLRIDPEALSGRIAQYLLGELESEEGSSKAGVEFGPNIRLSDEHLAKRLISQTEPTIAVNPGDSRNLVAGFHDLFPRTQDFVCRIAFISDGGQTWNLADVVRPSHGYSWYRWEYRWQPPGPGRYTLMSKATNNQGETQPMEFPNQWDGREIGRASCRERV